MAELLSGPQRIEKALEILRAGKILIYPTETFYGLGVDAQNTGALQDLVAVKGRPDRQPLPLLLPSAQVLHLYAETTPEYVPTLVEMFWPGPLTLILPTDKFSSPVQSESGGVAFRVSSHPVAANVVQMFGRCITTTSANRTGHPPTCSAKSAMETFSNEPIFVLDEPPSPGGAPSTVVDCRNASGPKLIREGAVAWREVQESCLRGSHV